MSTDMSTEDLLRQLEDQRTAFLALEQRVHTALRQQEAARQQDESPSSPTFSDGIGRQSTVSFAEPSRKSTGIASLLQSSAMSVDSDDEDDETYYVGGLSSYRPGARATWSCCAFFLGTGSTFTAPLCSLC